MRTLVFIFVFSLPYIAFGQSETIDIPWVDNDQQLSFPHALYGDGENSLPYFTKKIPWKSGVSVQNIRVEVEKATGIPASSLPAGQIHTIDNSPKVEYSIVSESHRPALVVKILPFITEGSDNEVKRLDRFRLTIHPEPAIASFKWQSAGNWKEESLLATGSWYKVAVRQSGIHRISYSQLQEMGISNPASVRIFGSGARYLPEKYSEGSMDDLEPVPVYFHRGSDNLFGPGDYLLFYAVGPVRWEYDGENDFFTHELHPYSWYGYYFITDSRGTSPEPPDAALSTESPAFTVTDFDYRDYLEEETYNLIKSGKEWYGDNFNVNLEENYPFSVPGHIEGEPVRIRVKVAARSNEISGFEIEANTTLLGSISLTYTDLSSYTATYAYLNEKTFSYPLHQDPLTMTVTYQRPNSNSEGWLDFITVNARSSLSLYADQVPFRDKRSAGPGNISEFHVGNCNSKTKIWEITDPQHPENISYTLSGTVATFRIATDGIREFIAFRENGSFPAPLFESDELDVGPVSNQNLHGLQQPDMIVLTPEILRDQADRLATFRSSHDGLDVRVVSQREVFNEFSSGTPDISAIRNFVKMFYDRDGGMGEHTRYLLLFGDGSYDNRNHTPQNPNLILTYQSDNSLSPTRSYVSDDFYGLLDTDESMYDGLLDIGIGRLPVSTEEEAETLVDKIISYNDLKNQGDWRNQLCFIGDDEDGNLHMRQADELATYVRNIYPSYNINKIYLDAYKQEKVATGFRYPEVTRAINDQMNRGALVINYTGHGGPNGLAHEQILTKNDINSWSNRGMLPLFMTATCEFSRYDEYDHQQDQEVTSAGEQVLLNPTGGGIALFTTTRLVYSGPNHALNEKFYEVVFEKDAENRNYRLGDIIMYSKNNTGPGINKRNFTLLGDPSMKLAYPENRVITDSINGNAVGSFSDTLAAFDYITVSGHLESSNGVFMPDFNGYVYPLVFDKEKKIETLSNDNDPVWDFEARNSILYSGKSTVKEGRFTFGFYIPKDINYAFGPGKISYYSNDSLEDAHGSFEAFTVGGIGQEHISDLQPPVISLFMNDTFFLSGGITDTDPVLLVRVKDNFGINTTGNGIGHDVTATLDEDRINAIVLNEFFQANVDSYNSGLVRYPYSHLEPGKHEVTVKLWDIHNNSAEASLEFVVMESAEMLLESLYTYPNPFFDRTWFNIEHNRPDEELHVVLSIYTLSGAMVRRMETDVFSPGYRLAPLEWDGTGTGGDRLPGGIYVYNVTLNTSAGEQVSDSGKLIIMR